MVDVVYHKDGTPQCSQCNTGYEDAERAEYCCSSCVNCGFRQHGMHERAAECCPCFCEPNACFCDENGDCCQDYLKDYGAEWHHANTTCHECGSDDVDYTKVYYCSQCGEDDLVPGEQCSCGNLVGSKDYFEQMICGDCDNAWIEDDYSAEVMWDDDSWTQVKDNTVADIIADEYLDMGEDYDDADEYARRAAKKMNAESPGTTSYYIDEMVSIKDEEDFQTLFNLYLDLYDDIANMESANMMKTQRYLRAKQQLAELSARLDELQTEVKIMPEFEFEADNRIMLGRGLTIGAIGLYGLIAYWGLKLIRKV